MPQGVAGEQESPRVGAGHIFGVALTTGAVGGALFGLRDSLRVLFECKFDSSAVELSALVSLVSHAMAWYTAFGVLAMGACGLAIWLLVLVGHRFGHPRLVTATGGVLTFLLASLALLFLLGLPIRESFDLPDVWLLVEVEFFACLCAVGAAFALHRARSAQKRAGTLLAGAVACVVALTVGSLGAIWVNLAAVTGRSATKRIGANLLLLAAVFLLTKGAYLLVTWLARLGEEDAGPRGRRALKFLAVGVTLMALGCTIEFLRREEPERPELPQAVVEHGAPNVIWIVLDTARADLLRCYGGERDTMPYVDRIASEGVLYEHAFSAAPWTLPSHASMLTGLLPSAHKCHAERQWLISKHTTIAELLRKSGYATYCYSNNWYLAPSRNLDQGIEKIDVFPVGRTPRRGLLFETVRVHLDKADLGAEQTTQRAMTWIDESLGTQTPFFLLLNYMEVHSPHGCTPERRHWIDPALPESTIRDISREGGWYALGRAKQTPETFAILRALYQGDATYLNRHIERLIEHVRQAEALDNTLLIITSDHGEEFGEHKLFKHAFGIYNTLLHVPLIVRYPKRFQPGKRVSDLVTTLDIFPTILDVTGIAWDEADTLYGRSLLAPPQENEVRYAVSERYLPYPWGEVKLFATGSDRLPKLFRRQKCIQDLQYKYIWNEDGDDELYDLASDPMEHKNLIGALPDKARELHERLAERVGGPERRRTFAADATPASEN